MNGLIHRNLKIDYAAIYQQIGLIHHQQKKNVPEKISKKRNHTDDLVDANEQHSELRKSERERPSIVLTEWIQSQTKPVVFVLEGFELFAEQRNQALLYHLMDLLHVCRVTLVGVTNRLDTMELLEKRVKSRFSHRQIVLEAPSITFDKFMEAAKKEIVEWHRSRGLTGDKTIGDHVDTFLNDPVVKGFASDAFEMNGELDYFLSICVSHLSLRCLFE